MPGPEIKTYNRALDLVLQSRSISPGNIRTVRAQIEQIPVQCMAWQMSFEKSITTINKNAGQNTSFFEKLGKFAS